MKKKRHSKIKQWLTEHRRLFFREGFLYVLVFSVALMFVDVPGVVQSVEIRRLNDLVTGINTTQLYAFTRGEIPASKVDWQRLMTYLRTVMKFFPSQEDAEMFLGYCEYYGLGQEDSAFDHFRRSADNMPYYFWNIYDTGLLLFKRGDYDHAISYLELALLAPGDKMFFAIGNSIMYRQFLIEVLNSNIEIGVNRARQNAVLLLSAAQYYKGNYDMAEFFAMKGVSLSGILNREPFYFYAGAIEMARGNPDKALPFFEGAIKAKSRNPLVYRYAAEILKKNGRLDKARKISQMGQALQQEDRPDQFPYPSYLRLEFY